VKLKIRVLNIIASLLLLFQLVGLLGKPGNNTVDATGINLIAYYIGYNIFLIFSVLLFSYSYYLRRKLKKKKNYDLVDSIGKND